MRKLFAAALLGLALAACGTREPISEGTVLSVREIALDEGREQSPTFYEHALVPEVAWKIEVQLDDGSAVTLGHKGERRYQPGERVHVLLDEEGALLL